MKDVDLWKSIWEEMHRVYQKGNRVDVEHVKTHRAQKKQQMTLFEKFDGGNLALIGKSERRPARKRRGVMQLYSMQPDFTV